MIHGGVMGGGAATQGHSAKHSRSKKHAHGKAKHNPGHHKTAHHHHHKGKVQTVALPPSHPRGLAVGDLLPVCAFESVAMSLRLAGQLVDDDEVAWLWELAGSPALGATIAAALDTTGEHGLAGFRPQWASLGREGAHAQDHLPLPVTDYQAAPVDHLDNFLPGDFHGLILGVDLPGPHAVLATPDGWWSWGELWTPWTTAVSEAWEVSWT